VAFDQPLDIEDESSLLRYLRATNRIASDETPRTRVLAGGVSNKTVLVERPSGEAWVLKQALPKLRTQADWYCDPSRIHREAEALRWLPKLAPAGTITPLVFEDPERYVLAMEAVPQPHQNWKEMLLGGRVQMDHVEQFATILGSIHRRAAEAGDAVRNAFADRSFFESLRVEPYYQYTASQVPKAAEFLHDLVADTRSRQLTVVHGDFSPKNILVHNGRLVLLDHEVIHWGDPAFDVGFALTHFLSKAGHLPQFRREFVKAANTFLVDYDAARHAPEGNIGEERRFARHALGCMLARAAGRSPLEYLSEAERDRQRRVVVKLMQSPPCGVADLICDFIAGLDGTNAQN
jgi:aminoglycoside phosphotransferase (APT) family kinase protein